MPKFSVIVISHNRPDFLKQALESLKAQSFKDFDVLLVDSGLLYEKLIHQYYIPQDFLIDVVESHEPKNHPCPPSWIFNNFIDKTKGEYIVCLCDDDLLMPMYLETFACRLPTTNKPFCGYTGQIRLTCDNNGVTTKVNKIVYATKERSNFFINCKIDYLQCVFNRAAWEECKRLNRIFPEDSKSAKHADGIFFKNLSLTTPLFPVGGVNCINRRTPSSRFSGTK